jgi:hypothetical protein
VSVFVQHEPGIITETVARQLEEVVVTFPRVRGGLERLLFGSSGDGQEDREQGESEYHAPRVLDSAVLKSDQRRVSERVSRSLLIVDSM